MLNLVFPPTCLACEQPLAAGENDFCPDCLPSLIQEKHYTCPRCTSSVGRFTDVSLGCSRCQNVKFHFDYAYRFGPYENLLREVLLRAKFGKLPIYGEALGRLWAKTDHARIAQHKPDVVLPVPLHWWRRLCRGFNQSQLLSQAWAKELGIAHVPRWLRRVRATPPQTQQVPSRRRKNMIGAFRTTVWSRFQGLKVLLVDDVLTTGSTLSEAARVIKQAGAKEVIAIVAAHRD